MHWRTPSLARSVFSTLLLALAGCGSGPKAPVTAGVIPDGAPVVTIRPSRTALGIWTFVSEVDDVRVPFKKRFMDSGVDAPVHVSAGFHQLMVTVQSGRVEYFWGFGHDFEAGHTYRVEVAGTFDMHVKLHDLTTGTSEVIKGPTRR